ncbi:MAG: hypothetical protein ACFFD7_06860 [Candidatus Thorarchaeota archaeon]
MFLSIFSILLSTVISVFGIVFVFQHRIDYGTTLNSILNILLYLFLGMIFLPLYVLSTEGFLNPIISLMIWKFSIIFWIISVAILSIIHVVIIRVKPITTLPSIFYALIGGIIINLTFLSNSIEIVVGSWNFYIFTFNNSFLLLILIAYNLMIFSYMWYNMGTNFSKFRDKRTGKILGLLTLNFTGIIIFYTFHLLFQNLLFEFIYLFFFTIGAIIVSFNIYKNPALFIELTNKIYDFIIFHKSGILLYSYNFETGKETDDSLLKGSILIGINHILSSLADKREQINLIKMKDRDILFEYDTLNGYAILLTTNRKNTFIEKAVNTFMHKFSTLNQEKFNNMNGLIDVSEFRNAKNLITEIFAPYILNP